MLLNVVSLEVAVVVCIGPLELVVGSFELTVPLVAELSVYDAVVCVASSELGAVVCVVVSGLLVADVSTNKLDETEPLSIAVVLVVDSPNTAELVVPIVFDILEGMLEIMDVWKPLLLSVEENEDGASVRLSVAEVKLVGSIVFDGLEEVPLRIDV